MLGNGLSLVSTDIERWNRIYLATRSVISSSSDGRALSKEPCDGTEKVKAISLRGQSALIGKS
jgi:hypothetical protein